MDVITCHYLVLFCSTGRAKLLGMNAVSSMQNIVSFVNDPLISQQ